MNTSNNKQQTNIHLKAIDLNIINYSDAVDIQRQLHAQVAIGKLPNLLLLLQHPHIYTLGRRGGQNHVLASSKMLQGMNIDVQQTDRGGQVTYHGPGQIVCYPIVNIQEWGWSPVDYVRALESAIIGTLNEFGIESGTHGKPTGVWVNDAKIAAIGVKISRGVTTHGLALNVNPDLTFYDYIVPCGMPNLNVTSMAELVNNITADSVMPILATKISNVFGCQLEWLDSSEIIIHNKN